MHLLAIKRSLYVFPTSLGKEIGIELSDLDTFPTSKFGFDRTSERLAKLEERISK